MKNEEKLREIIRKIIESEFKSIQKEELDEEELDETSSVSGMGGGDGYNTPHAFSKRGQDPKKKRCVQNSEFKVVEDKVNEGTINLRDKNLTPQHRLNKAVGYARKQMTEIEKIVDRAVKFRNENEMSTDVYWNRTNSSLKKLAEQLVRISHKLNNFK